MRRNAVAWAALVVAGAAFVSSRGAHKPLPAAPGVPAEGQKAARALSEAFEGVADFVMPSVVQISVERKGGARMAPGGRRGDDGQGQGQGPHEGMDRKDFEEMLKKFFPDAKPQRQQFTPSGTGSGFVYDDKGHILTNAHVVDDAAKIMVTFHDGETAMATVVGSEPDADVAVIKVDTTAYRPIPLGKSKDLKVGELVMAVGSPFGLSQTVTTGIVSATERTSVGINEYEAFIQTDAAINPGNSGGPLADMSGRVVGINSAIVTASRSNAGVGFAIPIDMAANLADKLIKDGKVNWARLGTLLQPLTPALAKQLGYEPKTRGLLLNRVVEGSPADKAGLKTGDVLTKFEDEPVFNVRGFRNLIATRDLGKTYAITFLREGHEKTASVVLALASEIDAKVAGDRPSRTRAKVEPNHAEVKDFGLSVQPLTPELAQQFGFSKGAEGVVVAEVKDNSPAADAGLQAGDLISKAVVRKKIQPVASADDFLKAAGQGEEFAVFVERGEEPGRFVTLTKVGKK